VKQEDLDNVTGEFPPRTEEDMCALLEEVAELAAKIDAQQLSGADRQAALQRCRDMLSEYSLTKLVMFNPANMKGDVQVKKYLAQPTQVMYSMQLSSSQTQLVKA